MIAFLIHDQGKNIRKWALAAWDGLSSPARPDKQASGSRRNPPAAGAREGSASIYGVLKTSA